MFYKRALPRRYIYRICYVRIYTQVQRKHEEKLLKSHLIREKPGELLIKEYRC